MCVCFIYKSTIFHLFERNVMHRTLLVVLFKSSSELRSSGWRTCRAPVGAWRRGSVLHAFLNKIKITSYFKIHQATDYSCFQPPVIIYLYAYLFFSINAIFSSLLLQKNAYWQYFYKSHSVTIYFQIRNCCHTEQIMCIFHT